MGYVKIGGHSYLDVSEGGIDAVYLKVAYLPENEGLPTYIVSDAKYGTSSLTGLTRAWINRRLRSAIFSRGSASEVATTIRNTGYVAVYTHVQEGGMVEVVTADFQAGTEVTEFPMAPVPGRGE